MAEENKSSTPPVTPVQPETDTRLADALALVKTQSENLKLADTNRSNLEAEVSTLKQKVAELEKKAKHTKAAPTGDVVFLDGKSWPVKRTVEAKFALDEVKKGNIEEHLTLVVIDKPA